MTPQACEGSSMAPRVLVASDYNARDYAHFALVFEFCRIVSECDCVDLIAPGLETYMYKKLQRFLPAHDGANLQRDLNRLLSGFLKIIKLKSRPIMEEANLEREYELFIFVAWGAPSLVELSRIRRWREKCGKAVAFVVELWASNHENDRAYLKLLDQFDQVFLANPVAEKLSRYTSAPCAFLPLATDCLSATPYPSPPNRVIDVYSIGNRPGELHKQLITLAERQEIFYLYDSLSSSESRMKDWREHRLLLANNIKRSRYFIAFNPAAIDTFRAAVIAGQQTVMPARLFEGTAGGAVLIGAAPQCPEFNELFSWPDAVIEISANPEDVGAILRDLDNQPERMGRLRRTNAIQALKKHDWVYRWEKILQTVGMEPLPQLQSRKCQLRNIARAAEEAPIPADSAITRQVPR